jgi:hypothetical protein
MLALSIRQPYAELILRGIKTVEYRSRPTPHPPAPPGLAVFVSQAEPAAGWPEAAARPHSGHRSGLARRS